MNMTNIYQQLTKFRLATIIIGTTILAGIIVLPAHSHDKSGDCSDYGNEKPPCNSWTQNQQSKQLIKIEKLKEKSKESNCQKGYRENSCGSWTQNQQSKHLANQD